ncbi:MAG: thioredoxin domain-containing protein [Thermodesulfobacteriota bacterium]
MRVQVGRWCVWLVVGAGLLVAALAGVSEMLPAFRPLCLGASGVCRETAQFVLFGQPVWVWGVAYYLSLAAALALAPRLLPLLVAAGLGAELDLAWIMYSQDLYCAICLANLAVVLLLAAITFARERFWQAASLCLLALLVSRAALVRGDASPAASQRRGDAVAARVGDAAITEAELDAPLSARLSELNERIHRLRQDRLDDMVRDRVLGLEAAARGMDVAELLRQEAESKAAPVTDAEVEALAEENRRDAARFGWSDQELRNRVREFLGRKRTEAAARSYVESLYPKYGVRFLLAPPESALLAVDLGDSPSLGPADAPVTVVEFSDYECPACRRGHAAVRAMREKYRDRVRWVFKDYPLAMHEHARPAAEAARCGGDQGRFWELQDMLYAAADLTRPGLEKLAGDLGLDRERFGRCLDEGGHAAAVDRDLAEAARLGLEGTPAYVVNGRLVSGAPSAEKFSQIIESALAAAESAGR